MLVDNGVRGDSRVQKEAASAASAGWDVILLGRSTTDQPETWTIGEAQVRLIPMPEHLGKRVHEYRRSWMRPLAYPPTGIGPHRAHRVKAWQADITARRAALMVSSMTGGGRHFAGRLILRLQAILAKITSRWVSLRRHQLTSAQKRRRKLDGPWDRFTMRWWLTVRGDRSWRRLEPRLWDFELAFGDVVDSLRPDLIHANDFYMLGVGARAVLRARAKGRQVKLVWDAHELVSGLKSRADNLRWLPAHIAHEREYAQYADAAITVSDELATTLQTNHRLAQRPTVVLNAPEMEATGPAAAPDIRKMCDVDPATPLLVYSGAAAPQRGLDIMVESLPQMPEVHVAFVVALPPSKYVKSLVAKAAALSVEDRVHLVPYVPYEQVVGFLSGADAGVIPIHHWPNHEIALITKFFEYAHARLPMIVSDVRTMAQATREVGQGEVFRAADLEDYVRSVKLVLADPARYRAAYDRPGLLDGWTWQAQSKILDGVYTRLVPHSYRNAALPFSDQPHVTVIVSVYNAMPYLTKTIRSLVEQTIGIDRFEVIAVDDGSTDGSGERLDAFARKFPDTFKVIHRPTNSGGPAVPNNIGLGQASGRYIFFLGADDYLGAEALERMVVAADAYGSDVLAPRMIGVNGRYVPTDLFTENQAEVSLFNSTLPYSMSNTKLFRRELLVSHGIRYAEDLVVGSDQPFTLHACLRADRISVLADYDYYFAVRRNDAKNVTTRTSHVERLRSIGQVMSMVGDLVPSDADRAELVRRHFTFDLTRLVQDDLLSVDRGTQHEVCIGLGQLVDRHLTEAVAESLDPSRRLRFRLAQLGRLDDLLNVITQDLGPRNPPIMVEGDKVYVAYDCFRTTDDLPDRLFLVSSGIAESIAARVQVSSTQWGGNALNVSAELDVALRSFSSDPVQLHINGEPTPGTVRQVDSRTAIQFAVPLALLTANVLPLGERRTATLQLTIQGSTVDVPLRMPSLVPVRKRAVRIGGRIVRLSVRRNRDGVLVIDYVPITPRRVTARVVRFVRRRRGRR
jgi:glycosyltransferase involved in cell wall biosynthesis